MKRSTVVIVLTALALAGVFGMRIASHRSKAREAVKSGVQAPMVATVQPSRATLTDALRFSGVIRPRNEVDVSAKVGGRVENVRVDVGEQVKAGQVLAVIEHTELGFQSQQAQAQVEAAQAQVLQARLQLAAAQRQRDRVAQLETGGAVAETESDRAELALKAADAALRAAQAQVKLAEASAGLAARAVQNSFVTAPFAGALTRRMASVGAQVAPGQPLFQVQDLAELKLASTVTAGDFSRLVLGQAVEIRVDELPLAKISGRIATLSPSLDPSTRRAQVEISIDNSEGRLLANMFAHARVSLGERHDVLTVPAQAVVSLPTGRVVYVVRDGRAHAVPLGESETDETQVAVEGLVGERDLVVIRGQAGLTEGQAVRFAPVGSRP